MKDLSVMDAIQREKANDLKAQEIPALNPEGDALAKHKRFTFDIVETPVDPLR